MTSRTPVAPRSLGWPEPAPVLVHRPVMKHLVLFALVALITGGQLWIRRDTWSGWVPTVVSSWTSAASVGAPSLVAAASAWWAGAAHRARLDTWLIAAPGRAPRSVLWAVLPTTMAATAGQVLPLVAAALWSWASGGEQIVSVTPCLLAVLSIIAATAAAATSAAWAGSRLPATVVLPLAIVIPYLWYFLSVGIGSETPLAVIGPADGTTWDYVTTSTSTTGVRLGVWVTALLALATSLVRHPTGGAARVVLGAAVALAILAGFTISPIPGAARVTCDRESPTICLTAPQEGARASLREDVDDSLRALPEELWPTALAGGDVPDGRAVLPSSKSPDPDAVAGLIGEEIFSAPCRATSPGRPGAQALLAWWWQARGLPSDGSAYPGAPSVGAGLASGSVVARLSSLDPTERSKLLVGLAPDIRSCSVKLDALR